MVNHERDGGGMSTKARQAARGKPCMVRIPGVCNGDPETTVLAHYRLAGTCGAGMKPDDAQAAWACAACHDVIDGRVRRDHYSSAEIRLMHCEGILRTQEAIRREA